MLCYCKRILKLSSNKEIFHKTWISIDKNKFLNQLISYCDDDFQLNNREYILRLLIKRMTKNGLLYIPEISYTDTRQIDLSITGKTSFIVVSVHNGFAFTCRFIMDKKRWVATIAADPSRVRRTTFKRSGVTSEVTIIERNKYCLARLLDVVKKGDVICCNIDFRKGNERIIKYVSPAMFLFANKNQLPVFFAKYEISDVGSVVLSFQGPFTSVDPINCASQFIEFVNSSRVRSRALSVEIFLGLS